MFLDISRKTPFGPRNSTDWGKIAQTGLSSSPLFASLGSPPTENQLGVISIFKLILENLTSFQI